LAIQIGALVILAAISLNSSAVGRRLAGLGVLELGGVVVEQVGEALGLELLRPAAT
jgi:hypothetical protein